MDGNSGEGNRKGWTITEKAIAALIIVALLYFGYQMIIMPWTAPEYWPRNG